MNKILPYFLLIYGLLSLSCCSSHIPATDVPKTGTYKIEVDMELLGAKRNYFIHIPVGFDNREEMPLVLVIHGAFNNAKKIEKETGFSDLADKEGFLAAYPNGGFSLFGFLQHWNAGFCCGKALEENVDDIGFILEVIEDIRKRFIINKSRIYMVGFSNGGMLTYLFASEHTEILAAAAPMAASIGGRTSSDGPTWTPPKPDGELPLIVFHAKDDLSIPYYGGVSPKWKGENEFLSVPESIDFWLENNQCEPEPTIENLYGGKVMKKTWNDLGGRNKIILYAIESWGHRWPGLYYTDGLDQSDPFKGFDAASIIWGFFKSYSR